MVLVVSGEVELRVEEEWMKVERGSLVLMGKECQWGLRSKGGEVFVVRSHIGTATKR